MPKYTVTAEQWVQELAEIEVDAETSEEAFLLVYDMINDGVIDEWRDGDGAEDQHIVEIRDDKGFLAVSEVDLIDWYHRIEGDIEIPG